jgi:hypothetical protein
MIEFVSTLPALAVTNGANLTLTFSNLRDEQNQAFSSLQEGDLVLVPVCHSHPTTGQVIDETTGTWTSMAQDEQLGGTARCRAALLGKFMGSSPDASIQIRPGTGGANAATGMSATAMAIRGVDTSIYDVSIVVAKGTGSAKPNPGAVTPLSSGAMIVVVGCGVIAAGAVFTLPGDLSAATNNFRSANAAETFDAAVGIGIKKDWASGAFDPVVWPSSTTDTANAAWVAFTLVLKPKAPPFPTRWHGISGVNKSSYHTPSANGRTHTMNNSPAGPSGCRSINGRTDARRVEISYDTAAATNTNGSVMFGVIDEAQVLGPLGSDTPGGASSAPGVSWRLANAVASTATFRNGAQGASQSLTHVLTIGDRLAIEWDPATQTATLFHRPVSTGVWYSVGSLTATSQTIPGTWYPYLAMYYSGSVFTGYFDAADQNGTPSSGFLAYDDDAVEYIYKGAGNRASRYLGNQAAPLPYIGPGILFAS